MACKDITRQCPDGAIRIDSRQKWNDTGLDLVAGRRYHYVAEGRWCDLLIETDADGFEKRSMSWARFGRRLRGERWFRLVGMIDKETPVVLGTRGEFVATASGRLYCFANDWSIARFNNRGCVCLRVREDSKS